jgi:hypothetical protein
MTLESLNCQWLTIEVYELSLSANENRIIHVLIVAVSAQRPPGWNGPEDAAQIVGRPTKNGQLRQRIGGDCS